MAVAIVWLVVALVAVGLEVAMADLTAGLIALGAASAAGVALVGGPIWLQGVVGVAVSLLGIAFVRPLALRHLRRSTGLLRTGVDALLGAEGRALSELTVRDGRILLRGEVWSARLDPDVSTVPVAEGTDVVVTRIDGAVALVHSIDPR